MSCTCVAKACSLVIGEHGLAPRLSTEMLLVSWLHCAQYALLTTGMALARSVAPGTWRSVENNLRYAYYIVAVQYVVWEGDGPTPGEITRVTFFCVCASVLLLHFETEIEKVLTRR